VGTDKRLVLITLYSGIFYDLHGDVNFEVVVFVAIATCEVVVFVAIATCAYERGVHLGQALNSGLQLSDMKRLVRCTVVPCTWMF
jgi:MinD-like ATPase involved in chromosome partitioning or flagellar assembly